MSSYKHCTYWPCLFNKAVPEICVYHSLCTKEENKGEKVEAMTDFLWALKALLMVTAAMKLEDAKNESYDKLQQCIKSREITANKGPCSQSYGFSSGHVRM